MECNKDGCMYVSKAIAAFLLPIFPVSKFDMGPLLEIIHFPTMHYTLHTSLKPISFASLMTTE
jgi:hypothetical protein